MLKKYVKNLNLQIVQRFSWTILIIFIYLLGRAIPMPTITLNQEIFADVALREAADMFATLSGAQLSSMTLFSLGLGPYMTAMILWRSLQVFRFPGIANLTKKGTDTGRLVLTVLVATVQGFGMTVNQHFHVFSILGYSSRWLSTAITMTFLICGALVVLWLGNQNATLGFGGITVMILPNIIINLITNVYQFFTENVDFNWIFYSRVLLLALIFFAIIMLTVILYRAEYRIPIRRVNLNNDYSESAYIPLRLLPSGGMPFMYGMTLLSIQPLAINGLLYFFPENPYLLYWAENTSVHSLLGMSVYLVLLYILAIGFAYFNFDPHEMAKTMRQNGDYIEHIRPGEATYKYIAKIFRIIVQIGAFFIILIAGTPLLLSLGQEQSTNLTLLFGSVFIVSSLLLVIVEEVRQMKLWKNYRGILDY